MNRWVGRGILVVAIAVIVSTLLPGVKEFIAVDRCLDSGAVYDYVAHTCRTDVQSLPAADIALIQHPDVGSVLVGLAVAVALARLFTTIDRRKRSSPAA